MSSDNDADVGNERLRKWRALLVSITEDTEKLIAALKEKRPEIWKEYFKAVAEGELVSDEVVWKLFEWRVNCFRTKVRMILSI